MQRLGRVLGAVLAAAIGLQARPARAACALVFPAAVACSNGQNAADAYRLIGRNAQLLERDSVRAMLERAGCVSFSQVSDPARGVFEIGRGRVPDADDWVDVLVLVVSSARVGSSTVYMAADWLDGACEPFRGDQ